MKGVGKEGVQHECVCKGRKKAKGNREVGTWGGLQSVRLSELAAVYLDGITISRYMSNYLGMSLPTMVYG